MSPAKTLDLEMASDKGQKWSQGNSSSDLGCDGSPRIDQEWVPSTCTQKDLEDLV